MFLVEADALLRIGQKISQGVDLLAERLLPFAGRFEFFFDGLPAFRVKVGRLDLSFELIDRVAADAALSAFRSAVHR